MDISKIFLLIKIFVIARILGHPLSDIYEICERYTQCRTIATLDERLCLGNTRSMPFWLPPTSLKSDEMAEHCHKSLKPYYKQLERLESEQSQQLLACLMEQAVPTNADQRLECHRDLRRAPKYDFSGDLMDRIPTNCFQGIERRLEKQCGVLRDCCSSVENCANFENSEITTKIRKMKEFIKDYGKQCQLGLATEDLLLNEDGSGEQQRQKPNGNIIVRFNTEEKPKQYSPKIEQSNQQRLLVRVFTAAEEIERLRESGDDVEADKLQKQLEDIEAEMSKKGAKTSELEGTVSLPETTPTSTATETEDEFWSTKTPKMITGLEIATEASESSTTTSETSTTTTESTTVTSTSTSTSSPTTTTTSPTTSTTTVPETTSSTTSAPTTTTRIQLITDTPQPEPSEAETEALIPNRSPPSSTHSTKINDPPKTATTNPPYPVDDILKKYAHVKTLNKLVEHFKDQNSESISKSESHQTTPNFIDSGKLHKFYDRWESSIREKLSTNGNSENDPEAAQEHARLLKTLNTLRNVIYNN